MDAARAQLARRFELLHYRLRGKGANLNGRPLTQFFGQAHESDLAQQIASEVFPQNSTIETSLAVKHEGPPILTSTLNLPPPPSE